MIKEPFVLNFSGNFGSLQLTVYPDNFAEGRYQEKGVLTGSYKDGKFSGKWENNNEEGLIEFIVSNNKLEGNWKYGLEKGALRGKWKGQLLTDSKSETIPASSEIKDSNYILNQQVIDSLIADLNKYEFWHFGDIINHHIKEAGDLAVGIALCHIAEHNLHYNLNTCMRHLEKKWINNQQLALKYPYIKEEFINNYLSDCNVTRPFIGNHTLQMAKKNFGEEGIHWGLKNSYLGYIAEPDVLMKLNGPVGIATSLCGCRKFDQVINFNLQKMFSRHLQNIFFLTIREIDEVSPIYKDKLGAFLATSIDSIYHDDDNWELQREPGILTNTLAYLLFHEFDLDFNSYMVENPILYRGDDLQQFGVSWINNIEYPVDYYKMAKDILK